MRAKAKENIFHPHDLLVRNFLGRRNLAADFFMNYLPLEWGQAIDFDSLKREPSDSVDSRFSEFVGDLRYSARFRGTGQALRVFVFLEHQSRPDRLMTFRLLEYVCAAYRQHLSTSRKQGNVKFPYPLAVVLHHGRRPWKKVFSMRDLIDIAPGVPADILQLPVGLVDLARIPSDQLRGHPAVCALLDSLQSASTGRLRERADSIFARLRGEKNRTRLDSWAYALGKYYASVQGRIQDSFDDLTRVFTALYSAREAEQMAGTIADELRREGIIQGKAEGKAEGRAEGKAESVITVLESRFEKIPSGLKKKLLSPRQPEQIEKLLKAAAVCKDLKEFQRLV